MPLHRALFLETNPSGPKYALWRLGRMQRDIRLPLVTVLSAVEAEIDHAGLMA